MIAILAAFNAPKLPACSAKLIISSTIMSAIQIARLLGQGSLAQISNSNVYSAQMDAMTVIKPHSIVSLVLMILSWIMSSLMIAGA